MSAPINPATGSPIRLSDPPTTQSGWDEVMVDFMLTTIEVDHRWRQRRDCRADYDKGWRP